MQPHYTPSSKDIERFWSYVDRCDPNACWNWRGGTSSKGYGNFWINKSTVRAHRFAWALINGSIADGFVVCHRCDNRTCCNPSHLFLGTTLDNNRDRHVKGHYSTGNDHAFARYSESDVAEMKRRYATEAISQSQLAKEFGMSQPQAHNILSGKQRQSG